MLNDCLLMELFLALKRLNSFLLEMPGTAAVGVSAPVHHNFIRLKNIDQNKFKKAWIRTQKRSLTPSVVILKLPCILSLMVDQQSEATANVDNADKQTSTKSNLNMAFAGLE